MKKLTLEVDSLRVESFAAAAAQLGQGTVDGHANVAGSLSYCSPCFFTQQAGCTYEGC
jgi:hypothetical protein